MMFTLLFCCLQSIFAQGAGDTPTTAVVLFGEFGRGKGNQCLAAVSQRFFENRDACRDAPDEVRRNVFIDTSVCLRGHGPDAPTSGGYFRSYIERRTKGEIEALYDTKAWEVAASWVRYCDDHFAGVEFDKKVERLIVKAAGTIDELNDNINGLNGTIIGLQGDVNRLIAEQQRCSQELADAKEASKKCSSDSIRATEKCAADTAKSAEKCADQCTKDKTVLSFVVLAVQYAAALCDKLGPRGSQMMSSWSWWIFFGYGAVTLAVYVMQTWFSSGEEDYLITRALKALCVWANVPEAIRSVYAATTLLWCVVSLVLLLARLACGWCCSESKPRQTKQPFVVLNNAADFHAFHAFQLAMAQGDKQRAKQKAKRRAKRKANEEAEQEWEQ